MTVKETVNYVLTEKCKHKKHEYELEEMEDNEHTVILHCGQGFFHTQSTKELREIAIHITATAKMKDEWPLTVFLTDIERKLYEDDN